jgi:hypothetical protein
VNRELNGHDDIEVEQAGKGKDNAQNNNSPGNDLDHQNENDHGNGKNLVDILINDVKYYVHRGHISVTELKQLGGVNPAWVLYLFGQTNPLDDNGSVTIKGGEAFLASARSGQSS